MELFWHHLFFKKIFKFFKNPAGNNDCGFLGFLFCWSNQIADWNILTEVFLATGFAPIWPGGLFDLFTRNLFACLFYFSLVFVWIWSDMIQSNVFRPILGRAESGPDPFIIISARNKKKKLVLVSLKRCRDNNKTGWLDSIPRRGNLPTWAFTHSLSPSGYLNEFLFLFLIFDLYYYL